MGSPRLTLEALSDWLCEFQAVFRAHGQDRVLVGGSGARALLDGRVHGLRDVDLFLGGDDGCGDARAELGRMVALLAAREVARAGPAGVRDKRRADPAAPLPALGEGAVCDYCAARGLCRKDFWA